MVFECSNYVRRDFGIVLKIKYADMRCPGVIEIVFINVRLIPIFL